MGAESDREGNPPAIQHYSSEKLYWRNSQEAPKKQNGKCFTGKGGAPTHYRTGKDEIEKQCGALTTHSYDYNNPDQ